MGHELMLTSGIEAHCRTMLHFRSESIVLSCPGLNIQNTGIKIPTMRKNAMVHNITSI